jgi:hypothetical protein
MRAVSPSHTSVPWQRKWCLISPVSMGSVTDSHGTSIWTLWARCSCPSSSTRHLRPAASCSNFVLNLIRKRLFAEVEELGLDWLAVEVEEWVGHVFDVHLLAANFARNFCRPSSDFCFAL